ncbi:type II toxin-antitoxin system RelB/DinJ family antitoxin (plasmid) [Mycetohabitans rhizoxinica]|uniref:type II toxin-antitoxin system RelB/DinJ family antitoxin n=1 Tax=Mycetohabitans rhizoxinica TaxID=412963 RepID=UPI0030CB99B5
MAATTMVHIRIDEALKAQAAQTLASMGLTVSDAIRVFLTRVVADKALPFATEAPNAASCAALVRRGHLACDDREAAPLFLGAPFPRPRSTQECWFETRCL